MLLKRADESFELSLKRNHEKIKCIILHAHRPVKLNIYQDAQHLQKRKIKIDINAFIFDRPTSVFIGVWISLSFL